MQVKFESNMLYSADYYAVCLEAIFKQSPLLAYRKLKSRKLVQNSHNPHNPSEKFILGYITENENCMTECTMFSL